MENGIQSLFSRLPTVLHSRSYVARNTTLNSATPLRALRHLARRRRGSAVIFALGSVGRPQEARGALHLYFQLIACAAPFAGRASGRRAGPGVVTAVASSSGVLDLRGVRGVPGPGNDH